MTKQKPPTLVFHETLEQKIFLIRAHKVMLDSHLAELYGVKTKALIQAVKRNRTRFPADFMFQLTFKETLCLRSQIVTSNSNRGGRRYLPYVFTEQGIAMLSSVLHSERAVQVNISIMRTFVKIREVFATYQELALKMNLVEYKLETHDGAIQTIFEAIQKLMKQPPPEPEKPKPKIGFHI